MRALVIALLVFSCNTAFGHDIVRSVFGDESAFQTFMRAKHVTAERMYPGQQFRSRELGAYARGQAVDLKDAQIELLRTTFTEPSAYTWHSEPTKEGLIAAKLCAPVYGVLITFRSDSDVVSLALCFQCDLFATFVGDLPGSRRVNAEEDMDRMRPILIVLAQQLFPNDPQIQSLK